MAKREKGSPAAAILELCRPRQWPKNLVVLAALLFSGGFLDGNIAIKGLAATLVFIALSAAVYALNDVLDSAQDKKHPVKKMRPIASGRVSPGMGIGVSATLAVVALAGATALGMKTLVVAVAYLVLQALYSGWLKHQVILDVFLIAAGFVLRAIGGAVAIDVVISKWLLLCTSLLALFLGLAKRRHEITLLEGGAKLHRKILSEYSAPLLDQMIAVVASSTVLAYALYTVEAPSWQGWPLMMATVPFVLYGVLRYLYLVHQKGQGGSPELILLRDPWIRGNVVLWALSSGFFLYLIKGGN